MTKLQYLSIVRNISITDNIIIINVRVSKYIVIIKTSIVIIWTSLVNIWTSLVNIWITIIFYI